MDKLLAPLKGGKTIGAGVLLIGLSIWSKSTGTPIDPNLVNGLIALMFITTRSGIKSKNGKPVTVGSTTSV